jgi:hypothetical protein
MSRCPNVKRPGGLCHMRSDGGSCTSGYNWRANNIFTSS